MRTGLISLTCLAFSLSAAPALADAASTATDAPRTAADASKAANDDKVVCKREKTLGSQMLGPADCRTKREWREAANAARESADRIRRERRLGASPAG